jgi:uncharacterized protein (TIGR03435 family)
MNATAVFCCLLLSIVEGIGQTADEQVTFEVASLKPSVGGREGSSIAGGPGTNDPSRITVTNRPLRALIIEAYGIRNFQIDHPAWMAEARFDIIAKVAPGATPQQARNMMRNLLSERFHLELRREQKVMSVFVLTSAKNGHKLKSSVASEISGESNLPGISIEFARGQTTATARKQTISRIITWLTGVIGTPVLDETRLKGEFDFSLNWFPDVSPDRMGPGDIANALRQQLGLVLETRRVPVEVLVVVSALKVPVEN